MSTIGGANVFSATAEYALRAIVCLGEDPETPLTTQQIAETTGAPVHYLAKVLQAMAGAGLLNAQRGRRGGFSLARPAGEVTVLEVVNAVDPIQRLNGCPLGRPEHSEHLCPLHAHLDNALSLIEDAFASSTIGDLLSDPTRRP